MDGGREKTYCCDEHSDDPHGSQSLQGTLSELDQQIGQMLSLLQQEEDNSISFTQRAKAYYEKRLVEDIQRLQHSLQEQINRLCIQSSHSSVSKTMNENFDDMDKVVKLGSPDSKPESVVEDPDTELEMKSSHLIGSPKERRNGSSSVAVGELIHKNNGSACIHELLIDSETKSSLEQRISCSEEMWKLMEDSDWYLKELMKRNVERRATSKELLGRIEKLVKENNILLEQHNKLMEENGALYAKLEKRMHHSAAKNLPRCSQVTEHTTSQLSRLKSLFLGW